MMGNVTKTFSLSRIVSWEESNFEQHIEKESTLFHELLQSSGFQSQQYVVRWQGRLYNVVLNSVLEYNVK